MSLPGLDQQPCTFDRWVLFCSQEVEIGRRQDWPTNGPGDDGESEYEGGDDGDDGGGSDCDGDGMIRKSIQEVVRGKLQGWPTIGPDIIDTSLWHRK